MRSGGIKASLTPLERLDGFIQEQKARREEFWSRHRQRAALQSTAVQSTAAPYGPECTSRAPAAKEEKKERARHWNPTNCVELEVHALKAIANREDAIRKLAAACAKVDEHVHLRSGFILSTDPLLRLFFSLVERVRERTVDAVECVASWERNVGRGKPFMYKNQPFLPNIGDDLKSLDGYTFIRSRFQKNSNGATQESCSDDPFLCALTPHGTPIEPTSSFTVRQGGRMDQKGLRLRSAVRLVEPRITSASLLTRLDPEPGKLPLLRARGRSTTRKGAHGVKPRAATHRDATRAFPASCPRQPRQPSSSEDLHLPSLMQGNMPRGQAKAARSHDENAESPERPAEASKSLAGEVQVKSKRRSVCSAPPSRGGTNTRDPKSTGDGAGPDSQESCSKLEHDSVVQAHPDDVKQQEFSDRVASGTGGETQATVGDAAPDSSSKQGAAAEQPQKLLVVGACKAELDEPAGEGAAVTALCTEGSSATTTLQAKLHVRSRVRVKVTPHTVVKPVLSVVRQKAPDESEAIISHQQDQQILPAENACKFTPGGITATTLEIDDSDIIIGEGASMRSAAAAHATTAPTSTAADLTDRVTVKLGVSSSGTVSTTLAVTSQPDAPIMQTADTVAGEYLSLSITPVSEGEERVLVSLHVVQQELSQHEQQSKLQPETADKELEAAAQEYATEQLQSAQQWLEDQQEVNIADEVHSQSAHTPCERVDATLESIELCFVTLEVIEEAVLALTEIPVAESQNQWKHDSHGTEQDYSADEPSSPAHQENGAKGACTPPCGQGSIEGVDSEDSLAVDEAIEDLIGTVISFGGDPAETIDPVCEQALGDVRVNSEHDHTARTTLVTSQMDLNTAGSSVNSLKASVDQELEASAVAQRLTVQLVVKEHNETVQVVISSLRAADPQLPLEPGEKHVPAEQISQHPYTVTVGLEVREDGSVCASLRCQEIDYCAQNDQNDVGDSHSLVSAQLLVKKTDNGDMIQLALAM